MAAARDLQVGALLKDPDIKTIEWSGTAPAQTFRKKEDLIGRGVISPIFANEPLTEGRLAPKGAGAGLAATIPVGMRAVAVPANDVVGLAGFVVPGMRVDVLIAGHPPGQSDSGGTITKTLLQNIEVLSAGQNIQKDAEGKPVSVSVINLLVTPAQAEMLSLASSEARIQLVLRNPLDTGSAKTPGTALGRLFTGLAPEEAPDRPHAKPKPVQRPPAPAPVLKPDLPPPPVVVEVLNGSKRSETKFPATEGR
jgi:pilus assembly protein CpaB